MNFNEYLLEHVVIKEEKGYVPVVVYAGRFQPFHKNHYETYKNLQKEFGNDHLYIATSNKVEDGKSPFNFDEKKEIITKMFGIPDEKVIQVVRPYVPMEVMEMYPENTPLVLALGKKDSDRLQGQYYQPYKGNKGKLLPNEETSYVFITPSNTNTFDGKQYSGELIRDTISKGGRQADNMLKTMYPIKDKAIFDLLKDKLGGK